MWKVPAPQTGGRGKKEQGNLHDLSAKAWGLSGLLPFRAAKSWEPPAPSSGSESCRLSGAPPP